MAFCVHSFGSGVAARILAILTKKSDPNEAFVAGLLHDLGLLVLEAADPDAVGRIIEHARRHACPLIESEQALANKYTHEDWGMAAARYWNMPDIIANAAGHHHHPWRDKETGEITAMVHMGSHIASTHGLPVAPGVVASELAWEVRESIGLADSSIDEIAKVVVLESNVTREIFGESEAA
jgi:HD-like signal output (HDOD) protein